MAGNRRQVFGTAVRWTIGWTTLGFLLGVLLMLSKAPPIAESGRKPSDMAFYSFWVPVTSIAGAVVGFCLGTAFAVLMIVGERWRAPIEARTESPMRHVPRLVCGAAAGCVLALPFGPGGMFSFAILGVASAASEAVPSAWWAKRTLRSSRARPSQTQASRRTRGIWTPPSSKD